ncbi:glycosyltransferase family 9 protein [Dickeya lacustris]|uniref:Glycosyltransferase family 9 protein n=1 Tax=Dickeya lacustris TaxID=2259638 RepID=A0ABY8G2H8_9GAMM|nr:glycosyltransferase family 9 protein [Dickeya lacustris]WFN54154.1 glycosyltransferase family 9 protein [Dickeya lacustris]
MSKKRFVKLRELNRQRNYAMKQFRLWLARLLFDKKTRETFRLDGIKSVLLLRDDDKIGDMIVSTSLIRELATSGYIVDVLCGAHNAQVITHNPYVNNIITAPSDLQEKLSLANQFAEKKYDLVIDMGDKISPFHLRFLRKINAKNVVGFNKEKYNLYNLSLSYKGFDRHITDRYLALMQAINIATPSINYDYFIPDRVMQDVTTFLQSLPGQQTIVINPYTADNRRDISQQQLHLIVSCLKERYAGVNIILIGSAERIQALKLEDIYINPFSSLESAAALIQHASLIISPDTAIVHLAAVWKKPLVCLYGNDMHGAFINSRVWGPGYPEAIQITSEDKHHAISTIAVDDIMNAAKTLLG